jgi:hypothetical protein
MVTEGRNGAGVCRDERVERTQRDIQELEIEMQEAELGSESGRGLIMAGMVSEGVRGPSVRGKETIGLARLLVFIMLCMGTFRCDRIRRRRIEYLLVGPARGKE